MLTRIGSDLEIVGKLAMLLMSRRRTVKPRPGHPKLLEFVEWWVRGLMGRNEAMGREVLKGSKMEGEELKIVRKRIWRERREKAREVKKREKDGRSEYADVTKGKEKEMVEDEMANEGYNSDFENEIVDHYAKLRSTLYVPDGTVFQPSPASTPSLTTGSSAKTQSTVLEFDEVPKPNSLMPEPLQWNKPHQPPGSSRYSVNQGPVESAYEPPRRGAAWQARQSAGSQAKEYRNMLTPLMEKPSPRSNPFKDPSVNEVSRHQPTMAAPREALSRAKTVKQPSRYGVSEHHPHAAASSLVRSKTVKEEKRRQTRWAEFCE